MNVDVEGDTVYLELSQKQFSAMMISLWVVWDKVHQKDIDYITQRWVERYEVYRDKEKFYELYQMICFVIDYANWRHYNFNWEDLLKEYNEREG